MLNVSQTALIAQTLRAALAQAAAEAAPGDAASLLTEAADRLAGEGASAPAPRAALPDVGAAVARDLVVSAEDTAAAMGHPDPSVTALGTPRLALWFELVASELLPAPGAGVTHVGVGVLVHHLGRADIGERVTVEARVEAAAGRRVTFSCAATVADRVVGLGVHQRVVLDSR